MDPPRLAAIVGTYDDDGNGTIEGSEFYRHFVKLGVRERRRRRDRHAQELEDRRRRGGCAARRRRCLLGAASSCGVPRCLFWAAFSASRRSLGADRAATYRCAWPRPACDAVLFGAVAQRNLSGRRHRQKPVLHPETYSSRRREELSFVMFGFRCFLVCYKRQADYMRAGAARAEAIERLPALRIYSLDSFAFVKRST